MLGAELLVAAMGVALYGWNVEGLQATTRFSGRVSLLIFSFIFILLPYHRHNLRTLLSDKFFLVFALAHGIHLAELISYNLLSGGNFILARLAGGALAYAFIFIMPLLHPRISDRKKPVVENIYLLYIWLVFLLTYLPRIQGKLPQVGGSYYEFAILFSWVCILLVIRIVLMLTNHKRHA